MPYIAYSSPPPSGNAALDEYLLEIHRLMFGIGSAGGSLDDDNVDVTVLQTHEIDGAFHDATSPLSEAKGGTGQATFEAAHDALAGNHGDIVQGAAVADASNSSVQITSAAADATYGTPERDLINELRGDVNTLVSDLNDAIAQINGLISSLETANVIST